MYLLFYPFSAQKRTDFDTFSVNFSLLFKGLFRAFFGLISINLEGLTTPLKIKSRLKKGLALRIVKGLFFSKKYRRAGKSFY